MFTGLFMDKMVGFLKLYFPVFLLGAVFGKLIEISGFSKSIVAASSAVRRAAGDAVDRAGVRLLTYGGVSLFVVVFAVYPFAAELFRQSDIPKRLIPGTIALGAFTFTMDALPGTPQIQNIIPTSFFGTNTWAAPWLGTSAAHLHPDARHEPTWNGAARCRAQRRRLWRSGHWSTSPRLCRCRLAHPLIASCRCCWWASPTSCSPCWIPRLYGDRHSFVPAVIGKRRAGGAGSLQGRRDLGGGGRAAGRHPQRCCCWPGSR
jgi:hypothetical protein